MVSNGTWHSNTASSRSATSTSASCTWNRSRCSATGRDRSLGCVGYSTHCQPFAQGVPSSQRAPNSWPSFALSLGLCETDTALTSASPRSGKPGHSLGRQRDAPSISAENFGGCRSMEASMLQQTSQWKGAVGCRQGLHQLLGNPSTGCPQLAGWLRGNWAAASADCWSHALQGCLPKSLSTSRGICHRGTVPFPSLWLDIRSYPKKPPLCLQRETWSRTQLLQEPTIPCFQPTALRSLG